MLGDQAIRLVMQICICWWYGINDTSPTLLPKARAGYRFGGTQVQDHMQFDGLWDLATFQWEIGASLCESILLKRAQDEFS